MKKIIALLLALAMIMMVGTVFAADPAADDENTTVVAPPPVSPDGSISITGLDAGDKVALYKVLSWTDSVGWGLTAKFASLSENATIKKIIANDASYELTKTDVEAIHAVALTVAKDLDGEVGASENSYTTEADPGMYLALITPAVAGTIYNPMIVSADFTAENGSETVSSSQKIASSAVAKKEKITIEKTSADITLDAGEVVKFTITSKIPAYAASYTSDVTYQIHDTMSTGLKLVKSEKYPFTVTSDGIEYTGEPNDGATEFTLDFDGAQIIAKAAEVSVTVEYYAEITNTAEFNINEETNDVEVIFSNNPDDLTKHGHLFDKVKEYTFTIDGKLFGYTDYQTGEIVKVGLNKDGSIATEYRELDNKTSHAALKDAVFGVYANKDDADAANSNYYTNKVFTTGTVTTDANGLMTIAGLDEGTYYLKELSAPTGYVKDTDTHSFTIEAHRTTLKDQTETMEDECVCTYDIEIVDYYTVVFDGSTTSKYEMTLQGPSIKEIKDKTGDVSSEIVNTRGVELPSTGGIGTTIFYILGGVLVIGAVVILVARRKAHD